MEVAGSVWNVGGARSDAEEKDRGLMPGGCLSFPSPRTVLGKNFLSPLSEKTIYESPVDIACLSLNANVGLNLAPKAFPGTDINLISPIRRIRFSG